MVTFSLSAEPNHDPSSPKVPNDLGVLIKVLENDQEREKLLSELKNITKSKETKTESDQVRLSYFEHITHTLNQISSKIIEVSHDALMALEKFWETMKNPEMRKEFLFEIIDLLVIFAVGLVVNRLVWTVLRPYRTRLDQETENNLARKTVTVLKRIFADILPILAFSVITLSAIKLLNISEVVHSIGLLLLASTILMQIFLLFTRILCEPNDSELRLLAVSDEVAREIYGVARVTAYISIYGFAFAELLMILEHPHNIYELIRKSTVWPVILILILFTINVKVPVRKWILDQIANQEKPNAINRLLIHLAYSWHWWIALYFMFSGITLMFETMDSFNALTYSYVMTGGIIIFGYWLAAHTKVLVKNIVTLIGKHLEFINDRKLKYISFFSLLFNIIIIGIFSWLVLEVWETEFSATLLAAITTSFFATIIEISMLFIIGFILWEANDYFIEKIFYYDKLIYNKVKHKKLFATLIPLLKSLARGVISITIGLMILSEFNVDILPLLAGTSIIGFTLALGGKDLVKDAITAIFIMLEDTLNMGDVVTIGSHFGVVENLTIRSVHIRDYKGCVHVIPFSSIKTITNSSIDYGYSLVDVPVAYHVKCDEAMQVLENLGKEIQTDPQYSDFILDPIRLDGFQSFDESGYHIRVRFKTKAGKQFHFRRVLNQKIKEAFDRAGIDFAVPKRIITQTE